MKKQFVLVRRLSYITLGYIDRLTRRKQDGVIVLCYHSIANDDWVHGVSLANFKRQISYLAKRYRFITVDELSKPRRSKKPIENVSILLTFDDGYKDIITVKTFLRDRNIKPLLFLLSDTAHVKRGELETKRSFLSKKEIASLVGDGWALGCHSATHADFSKLTASDLTKEIVQAKHALEKTLKQPITTFAYPKGRYDDRVIATLKKARYQLGFSMDDGVADKSGDRFTIPRIGINRTHTLLEFMFSFSPSVIALRRFLKKYVAAGIM